MNEGISNRIRRIYSAIDATEELDLTCIPARVSRDDKSVHLVMDFKGGQSDEEIENIAHQMIYNIAHLKDHLKRWAKQNDRDKKRIESTVAESFDLQIILDLSNLDKHGPGRADGSYSKRNPRIQSVHRILQMRTQAKKGSYSQVQFGLDGIMRATGDGSASVVASGDVLDGDGLRIGDLREIATRAIDAWESLMREFGLLPA